MAMEICEDLERMCTMVYDDAKQRNWRGVTEIVDNDDPSKGREEGGQRYV